MLLNPTNCLNAPGVRLVALSSTGKFVNAPAKLFRTLDAKGKEVVDLAAIFDAENRQAEMAAPGELATLSATPPKKAPGHYKLPNGQVDLGAIFDDEATESGLACK